MFEDVKESITMLDAVIKKIEEQQEGLKDSPAFFVGENLKEILKNGPLKNCEIVLKDLDVKEMSISECEKNIASYAKDHRRGKTGFCPPTVANEIICKFYGISTVSKPVESNTTFVDLSDFIWGAYDGW